MADTEPVPLETVIAVLQVAGCRIEVLESYEDGGKKIRIDREGQVFAPETLKLSNPVAHSTILRLSHKWGGIKPRYFFHPEEMPNPPPGYRPS